MMVEEAGALLALGPRGVRNGGETPDRSAWRDRGITPRHEHADKEAPKWQLARAIGSILLA